MIFLPQGSFINVQYCNSMRWDVLRSTVFLKCPLFGDSPIFMECPVFCSAYLRLYRARVRLGLKYNYNFHTKEYTTSWDIPGQSVVGMSLICS